MTCMPRTDKAVVGDAVSEQLSCCTAALFWGLMCSGCSASRADCTPFVDAHGKLHLAMASYADLLQWPFFPPFSSTWTLLSCSGLVIQRFLLRRQILLCLKSPAELGCPIKQLFAPHFLLFLSIFFMHHSFLHTMTWIELAEGLLLSVCPHIWIKG